jgi:hypothetical protein
MLPTLIGGDGGLGGDAFVGATKLDVAGTRTGAVASMALSRRLMEAPTPLEGKFQKERFTGTWPAGTFASCGAAAQGSRLRS